ncbi:MAG TPA: hypothetical protein P5060_02475 [Candidatus Absconditabacterales bacterium]|nr:hypothetical protein [Candidatus Absconditabacterales bacterium]
MENATQNDNKRFEEFLTLKNEIDQIGNCEVDKKERLMIVLQENYVSGTKDGTLTRLIYDAMIKEKQDK